MTDEQSHWERVYSQKRETDVSWFQETPAPSLELIEQAGARADSAIADIGGGASRLVDALLEAGYLDLTILDLSSTALAAARARLGNRGEAVEWIVADARRWQSARTYDLWHDRAAFHFLTSREDQQSYVATLRRALRTGGRAIIGTFALDGPEKCSGLPVERHDEATLSAILGTGFTLLGSVRHEHVTPWNAIQKFQFSTFRLD